MINKNFLGTEFIWWKGVVEDRQDPLKLGRAKIRLIGWHTSDKSLMPTDQLPWALPITPIDSGKNSVGLREGDWCIGFFLDGESKQYPVVIGTLPGISEEIADPNVGFYDATSDENLTTDLQPRPPEFSPISDEEGEEGEEDTGKFSDTSKTPGNNIAFGELKSDYNANNYKFDVNKDGKYNQEDARQIIDTNQDGIVGNEPDFFGGDEFENVTYEMSRYPLEPFLNEPSTPRLARNEGIESTIISKKNSSLSSAESASHESSGVGSDFPVASEAFVEPSSAYAAKYPYNHVYESESGHVVEIDDTPKAERMHWYHRSGTSKEIHPNGKQVTKIVDDGYEFTEKSHYHGIKESADFSAGMQFKVKAGSVININSGSDTNVDVGNNHNLLVKGDQNTKVSKNCYTVIKGDCRILVEGNLYIASEGDIKIKAKGDILMDAENIISTANGICAMNAGQAVTTDGPLTYFNTMLTDGTLIKARVADGALLAADLGTVATIPSGIAPIAPETDNDADNKDNLITDASEPKEGFVFPDGPSGDLYKPISDSTGKAVTLSTAAGQQALYEALPTGQLETITIQYKHKNGAITSWEVVRPIHTVGKLIAKGQYAGIGNGNRHHYRYQKAGEDYPKQMFLVIGDTKHLILDATVRHESL